MARLLLVRALGRSGVSVGVAGALSLGAVLGAASDAAAQERNFDLERYAPAPDGDGFLTVPGTRTPGPWRWNVGLSLSYAREPLIVNIAPRQIVSDRLDGNLYLQLGILGQIAVVLNAPVALWQSGAAERIDGGAPLMVTAIRDPRLAVRVRVLGEDATVERERHEGEGIALQAAVTLPIGHEGTFAGEGAPQVEGAMIADFHLMDIGVGGILGFRHRFAEPVLFGSSFRNQLFGALAVQVPLFFVDHVVGLGELDVTTDAENAFGDAGSTSAEWRLGFRITAIRDVELTFAGGTGFVGGAGSPLARGIASISWAPRVHDRDHDGIDDDHDACMTLPEDVDDNEDTDGCPEPDNDHDLVPDLDDRCPNEAIADGRDLDDDGCTDPFVDGDGDGLEDANDTCPQAAEDRDEHEDGDGCPDLDDDGDGVPDTADRCRAEPEDRDEHEDADGCPDLDDDGDGVPDTADRCRAQPEDRDGHEDEDGCADLDDDHDGVPDASDTCRDQAETINGVSDDDGCPDRGGRALWTREREPGERTPASVDAHVAPPVWVGSVTFSRTGLAPASEPAIAQLARVLVANAPFSHVLDVGAPEGSDALLADLTQRLRAALDASGASAVRFEVRRSSELPRGRVRVVRLLVGGAALTAPISAASAEALRAAGVPAAAP
jgi:OOP family OmpA-OmpF porin